MTLKSINPYTGKVIQEFETFSDTEINEALEKSDEAFDEWKRTTFEYRKKLMLKVADLLKESNSLLAQTITKEMGKTKAEATTEIEKCAWVCEHYAENAESMLHREAVATDAHMAFVQFEPLGTILGVMPWNFPFWQVFRFAAPTLMAGNVIVLKHASNVQISARAIQGIFEKAGFPPGVFQNLVIGSEKVKDIVEHKVVKAISLTGSEQTGAEVAQLAGKNIKKTVLELGGNNSFIVLKDAEIDKAVEIGLKARMQNAGQSCIAAKRFIVHKNISEEFIEKFRKAINNLSFGDPFNMQSDIGPLSSKKQAEVVIQQVRKSVEMGAKVIAGDMPEGALYPPTLVTGVKPGMPLFEEEVFGPVAPIIIAQDTEEAIYLSNLSNYGLGVSLFTNNLERAEELIPEFEDGAVFVNALVKSHPRLPFGGTKQSGYGRELALNGIREFVNVKTVYIDKFQDIRTDKKRTAISMGTPG
ncbi:NAD-dependent succinate-semialdehyde dehydrogenase [Maribellus maritimus]|uniref:NAD-dependent succinate-semialdehyde dehydrogenase n=1 Tax=Maribellus maritimus TaxID=2870838 RepID=UPI001EE9CE44|nr:NAD-dependent succinate-semialdehyde dehydrogenase [Maribellus maritimus]MCG6187109.1 NAD-dependent succinate-semialdehyde dehydrogenase [Maribellus maritimus]